MIRFSFCTRKASEKKNSFAVKVGFREVAKLVRVCVSSRTGVAQRIALITLIVK